MSKTKKNDIELKSAVFVLENLIIKAEE